MSDDYQDIKEILRRIEDRQKSQKSDSEKPSFWYRARHWIWGLILAGTIANGAANIQEIRRIGALEQRQTEIHQKAMTCTDNFAYAQSIQPARDELMMIAGRMTNIRESLERGGQSEQELTSIQETLIRDAKRTAEISQQLRRGPANDPAARAADERIKFLVDQYLRWEDEKRRREKQTGEKLVEAADTVEKAVKAITAIGRFAVNVRPDDDSNIAHYRDDSHAC